MDRMLGLTSLDLLEAIFEPLVDNPFFVKDAEQRYVAANRAMLDLCGARFRSELIGRTARDIYATGDAARYEMDDRSVLAGCTITDRVEEVRGVRRAPVWIIFNQTPLRGAGGEVVGIVGTSRRMRLDFSCDARFERFAAALRQLRARFDAPLDCAGLARSAGVSISQLERDFRKVLGVTPRTYQQRVRMEEALRLIGSGRSIAEVALQAGFTDHSSFSRRFRAATGMTPSHYRESALRRPHLPSPAPAPNPAT